MFCVVVHGPGIQRTPIHLGQSARGAYNVKVRLDRALAYEKMLDLFGDTLVTHLQTTESDHCAVLIRLQQSGIFQGRRRERPFRYENMWRRHETYESTVVSAWSVGCTSLRSVQASLGGMQAALQAWEREQFGSVRKELSRLRHHLEEIRYVPLSAVGSFQGGAWHHEPNLRAAGQRRNNGTATFSG